MNTQNILADTSISVTELKKNPIPVVVLNHNKPVFYCVPSEMYEALMDKLEDVELNTIADARVGQKLVKVSLDDL
jgi:antitoxin StbD